MHLVPWQKEAWELIEQSCSKLRIRTPSSFNHHFLDVGIWTTYQTTYAKPWFSCLYHGDNHISIIGLLKIK